jgi:formate dehydrogenase accessory protein FdhE
MPNDANSALLQRAARAALIEKTSPSAGEPLRFAAGLFRAQARFAEQVAALPLTGTLARDAAALIGPAKALLDSAARAAPAPLAQSARERRGEEPERFVARLQIYWLGDLGSRDDYLSRAILRPYCAALAQLSLKPDRPRRPRGCPFCGGAPGVAVRRPDADALRRLLCCALCGGEWPVSRIHCPACDEREPARLPTFQAPEYPFARIEACDTCRSYVKSIDLSEDGRLIPEVDELASLGLDLWAAEEGYARIEPGLAGL